MPQLPGQTVCHGAIELRVARCDRREQTNGNALSPYRSSELRFSAPSAQQNNRCKFRTRPATNGMSGRSRATRTMANGMWSPSPRRSAPNICKAVPNSKKRVLRRSSKGRLAVRMEATHHQRSSSPTAGTPVAANGREQLRFNYSLRILRLLPHSNEFNCRRGSKAILRVSSIQQVVQRRSPNPSGACGSPKSETAPSSHNDSA